MPWSGGVYTKANNATGGWTGDATAGIGIEAGRHDTQDNDFTTGITSCLNKDGSNAATGNLNIGNFKLTSLGSATARTDAITAAQVQDSTVMWGGTSGGSANTQTLTLTPALTAYAAGQTFRFVAGFTNTGATTLNVNSLGAKNIYDPTTKTTLIAGEIMTGAIYSVTYDGTQFLLTNTISRGSYSADALAQNRVMLFKSRGTTAGTNTIVQNGDQLGGIWFHGANGTGFDPAAAIIGSSDGVPGASADMPGALLFFTSSDGSATLTERGRINSSGQLLMGRTTAVATNEVIAAGSGSGTQYITVHGGSSGTAAGGALVARNGTTSIAVMGGYSAIIGGTYDATPLLYFNATPKVQGITAGAGTWPMKWNTTTNAWTYDTSKRSAKENIRPSKYGLADVLQLNPCQFNYHASEQSREDVGFIADEVFAVIPELAPCDADGEPAGVSYDRLTAVLCKAIQQLNTKVEALEARIAELEA